MQTQQYALNSNPGVVVEVPVEAVNVARSIADTVIGSPMGLPQALAEHEDVLSRSPRSVAGNVYALAATPRYLDASESVVARTRVDDIVLGIGATLFLETRSDDTPPGPEHYSPEVRAGLELAMLKDSLNRIALGPEDYAAQAELTELMDALGRSTFVNTVGRC